MLRALARHRAVLVVTVVAVALAAVAVPAPAGAEDHCLGGVDQHCVPALLQAARLPEPAAPTVFEASEPAAAPPGAVTLLLKIPLIA